MHFFFLGSFFFLVKRKKKHYRVKCYFAVIMEPVLFFLTFFFHWPYYCQLADIVGNRATLWTKRKGIFSHISRQLFFVHSCGKVTMFFFLFASIYTLPILRGWNCLMLQELKYLLFLNTWGKNELQNLSVGHLKTVASVIWFNGAVKQNCFYLSILIIMHWILSKASVFNQTSVWKLVFQFLVHHLKFWGRCGNILVATIPLFLLRETSWSNVFRLTLTLWIK